MRSPTPRQWTAIAITAVALPALTYTAWPLGPFLADLVPQALPLGRILWGLLLAAALVAAAVLARSGGRGSPVWLGWLVIAAWALAIAAVAGIVLVVWLILDSPGMDAVPQLSPQQLDAIATRAFAVVAGLGGVALLVIAYRRQRTTENGEQREVTKLFTERFTTASQQLGSEHAAVRLAGVHALAHLADDAPEGREDLVQMVIDVLCAYLRMPYTAEPEALPKNASKIRREEQRERELEFGSFREVRHTIIRIIGNHLRQDTRWRGKDYDFTGVVFDGGSLSRAHFTGGLVSFTQARFIGGLFSFYGAHFVGGEVSFDGAHFRGGEVFFDEANFAGSVSFFEAHFDSGDVSFDRAEFTSEKVIFIKACFVGGSVTFTGAQFTSGRVMFDWARFVGGSVTFTETRFTGGETSFVQAHFGSGEVGFTRAEFTSGKVNFLMAQFIGGLVTFTQAQFTGGKTIFSRAWFASGKVSFLGSHFRSGTVVFDKAEFTGGTLDFSCTSGQQPPGLPDSWWAKAEGEDPDPDAS
ncbi:pentapeptide repeat-containing protein [Nocardiopsis ganjiahuensis]|uniref:pentapeptide repeat-containing protein n=1 Tax=Nocardiopsis ganjiahuensis TaxID=239984 RepID=UPI0003808AEC|nr:pentapeptide repeat-containing protein [Nocardiopsis ganjiahuensis]